MSEQICISREGEAHYILFLIHIASQEPGNEAKELPWDRHAVSETKSIYIYI